MAEQSPEAPDRDQVTGSDRLTSTSVSREAPGHSSKAADAPNAQAPLPPHWEQLLSSDGTAYYANHATRTTTWNRPGGETMKDPTDAQEDLPPAWEALVDDEGRTYYANHASRSTTFDRPNNATDKLPAGWEIQRDVRGVACHADRNTHNATWTDPRSR